MLRAMGGRRWEGDERGEGIADARPFAPGVEELLEATRLPNWVAEQPEVHLLPHLQRSCESLPLELLDARVSGDGSFEVELRWTGEVQRIGDARVAVFSLLGGFAEASTYVRQLSEPKGDGRLLAFEIVTGFLERETSFTSHGHTVRVSVAGVV